MPGDLSRLRTGFELRPHQDIGADEVIARLDDELPALMRRRSARVLQKQSNTRSWRDE